MPFALEAIQRELQQRQLDGWLLYDFAKRDPIAYQVLGLEAALVTRRWFYFIPVSGVPQKLVHRIEAGRLDALPGEKRLYAAWAELREKLGALLGGARKVAMQYSPMNNIPYISLVDAGTIELVRSLGKEISSSADLVQLFQARWTEDQHQFHLEASRHIDDIMRATFEEIGARLRDRREVTEYGMQQWILEQFRRRGLVTDDPPVVAVNENSGNPHYEPAPASSRPIHPGDWVLLDIWGKLDRPGGVYYDITWVGYADEEPPARIREVFDVVRAARDAAVEFVQRNVREGKPICGFEVDDVARGVIRQRGYADYFIHRTGHSLGEQIHSTGANMDNLETHDERRIIAGTCFSVEPGIYLPEFGVRLELNVYVAEGDAGPTGKVQQEIVRIPA